MYGNTAGQQQMYYLDCHSEFPVLWQDCRSTLPRAAVGLPVLTVRLSQRPVRVYVMEQRTKWGNCSSRGNLSFNWRLVLAPNLVLWYLVTHEVAHLVVPDHSAKFWLTVQGLCPEMERAKQWLSRHHAQLTVNLDSVVGSEASIRDGVRP